MLSPGLGLTAVGIYIFVLLLISYYRSRSATLEDYYIGSRNSTWWMVTLGMISDSVSGVTYISVPGSVATSGYAYFQIVMGYFLGYLLIVAVLLPLYYRLNLVSIYSYLGERFGKPAQKMGSLLFICSRTFGSAARLYISVLILHQFLFSAFGISPVTAFTLSMALIVLYTFKGGIKSLVWTEAYQSVILLGAIFFLFGILWSRTPDPVGAILKPQMFFFDFHAPQFFLRQILGGMLITASMNGLDQNIMQLNLSCKSSADAQKNMLTLGFVMLFVNFIFLALGALIFQNYLNGGLALPHAATGGIASDQLISNFVFHHLGVAASLFFITGLAAATFSSAGTILPAIASSIEIDLLPERFRNVISVRWLHVLAAVVILGLILILYRLETRSLIDLVLRCSGYTYGPLVGLYGIGIFTRLKLHSRRVPLLVMLSILTTSILDWQYHLGVELIAINALIFIALALGLGLDRDSRVPEV